MNDDMMNMEGNLNNNPLVSIVILNYNSGNLLLDCIKSILHTNYSNYEIIVVDNASNDQSHIKFKQKFSQIKLIENDENLGYCEGNNIGVKEAHGDFIIILNPDTLVDPNWIKELISSYEEFGEGLYQPKILTTADHSILMSTGNMIQLFGFGFSRSRGELDKGKFQKHEIIGYVSGACLFTSSKTFKKLNMFDSFLFAYHDDLDLGWRAAMIGIQSHYIPKSIVYHPIEGFSFKWSPFKFYLLERNRMYCILTHYSRTTFYKILPSLVLVEVVIFFFYLKKRMLKMKFKATWNLLMNWKHIKEKYVEIQNCRTIEDKKIIQNFTNNIDVPLAVTGTFSKNLFNNFILKLSQISRFFI